MQSVRIVMREVGIPDGADVLAPQDVSDYLEYQYLSKGYKVQDTHYLGTANANATGYKILFILVKDEDPEEDPEPALVGDAVEKVKAKK